MDRDKFSVFTEDAKFAITKNESGRATLKGYAIVWNTLSSDRGGFKVRLLPGSANFANPTFALWNHDTGQPLGLTADNSLRILPHDGYGVPVEIDLPDTTYGRDTEWLVANNKVKGMSFAMLKKGADKFVTEEAGEKIVNYKSFVSDEVTVTAFPAFTDTTITVADANAPALNLSDEIKSEENVFDATKELGAETLKHEKYRLPLYGTLAEIQRSE